MSSIHSFPPSAQITYTIKACCTQRRRDKEESEGESGEVNKKQRVQESRGGKRKRERERKGKTFLSHNVSFQAPFLQRRKKKNSFSGRQVRYSVSVSLPLCVCESDWVLQRALHGGKGGWEQDPERESERERASERESAVQGAVKEM